MSSMVKFSSSSDNSNSHDDGHEQLDFLHPINSSTAAAANLALSPDAFLGAATALKELVVEATWTEACAGGGEIVDPMFYTGLLGTAFTCLRFYEATGSHQDLQLSANIVRACATAVANSSTSRCTTFLCGRGGIYAFGAVIANHSGDHHNRNFYLAEFLELAQERALPVGPKEGGFGMSYDLLHGRAGFLWAALFINKHIGQETVPSDLLNPIVQAVIAGGRTGASDQTLCPLMYRWHGTRYWGAAHGLAGILHVLLHFPLSEQDTEDVKKSLRYMMSKRFPHSGNYPSSEGKPRDNLVQWSHGAGGMALTLCKASQVFPEDREFRDGAIEAGEVVWKRGLSEKPGLSDGAAGNAYVFLALFRLTGDAIYEDRAKAFGGFLYRNVGKLINNANSHNPGHGFSLSEGLAGTACLWSDLFKPGDSRFPGFEI